MKHKLFKLFKIFITLFITLSYIASCSAGIHAQEPEEPNLPPDVDLFALEDNAITNDNKMLIYGHMGSTWQLLASVPGQSTMNSPNTFSWIEFQYNTNFAVGETVNMTFNFSVSNMPGLFSDIEKITVGGVPLEGFKISNNGQTLTYKGPVTIYTYNSKLQINVTFGKLTVFNNVNFEKPILKFSEVPVENEEQKETNSLLGGIKDFISQIFDAIVNLPSTIYNLFKSMLEAIKNAIDTLKTAISNMLQTLIDWVKKIQQWLLDLLNGILEGLKYLFIPSDDYFMKYFNSLKDFFTKKLGILVYPFEFFITLCDHLGSLGSGSGIINIPSVDINGWHIIDAQSFNLKQTMSTALGDYYELYFAFVDVIFIVFLINFAMAKFNQFVKNQPMDAKVEEI